MKTWRQFLPEEELSIYKSARLTQSGEFGNRAALLIIACTHAFIGSSPDQTISEAIEEYHTACGPVAWQALPHIEKVLKTCRDRSIPVIFTQKDLATQASTATGATKGDIHRSSIISEKELQGNKIIDIIKPLETEWILKKARASAFHGTLLATYLKRKGIDTLIVCGTTTSGCVRATVVDAFSYGLNVFVIDDCCFDRANTPHIANLWDMNAKYATVVSHDEIVDIIEKQN